MTFHELIIDEITQHEILHTITEQKIMIDGDELEIQNPIDMIHEILEVKDSDHVMNDGTCLVDENGQR